MRGEERKRGLDLLICPLSSRRSFFNSVSFKMPLRVENLSISGCLPKFEAQRKKGRKKKVNMKNNRREKKQKDKGKEE